METYYNTVFTVLFFILLLQRNSTGIKISLACVMMSYSSSYMIPLLEGANPYMNYFLSNIIFESIFLVVVAPMWLTWSGKIFLWVSIIGIVFNTLMWGFFGSEIYITLVASEDMINTILFEVLVFSCLINIKVGKYLKPIQSYMEGKVPLLRAREKIQ